MKKLKHSEVQIVNAIKEHESGRKTEDLCRELGIHKATFMPGRRNTPAWTISSSEG